MAFKIGNTGRRTLGVGEDVFAGRNVGTTGAAVVTGVGFHLGHKAVLVFVGDQFSTALTGHGDSHLGLSDMDGGIDTDLKFIETLRLSQDKLSWLG